MAAPAGVSKPTIYRRWPEAKGQLVELLISGMRENAHLAAGLTQRLRESPEAVARGTTSLNILQQTGASIGTAVLGDPGLRADLEAGHGGIGGVAHLALGVRHHIAPPGAGAFGQTFWWAVGLLRVAFVAALLLPKSRPEVEGAEGDTVAVEAQPVPLAA